MLDNIQKFIKKHKCEQILTAQQPSITLIPNVTEKCGNKKNIKSKNNRHIQKQSGTFLLV